LQHELIFIVDDSSLSRNGMSRLIEAEGTLNVEARSPRSALQP
jgi:CheY-like chemotaxis protein